MRTVPHCPHLLRFPAQQQMMMLIPPSHPSSTTLSTLHRHPSTHCTCTSHSPEPLQPHSSARYFKQAASFHHVSDSLNTLTLNTCAHTHTYACAPNSPELLQAPLMHKALQGNLPPHHINHSLAATLTTQHSLELVQAPLVHKILQTSLPPVIASAVVSLCGNDGLDLHAQPETTKK